MAPERVEGKKADHRTDVFAFGAVAYEMVSGQRAFQAESQASLIGAILKDDPPVLSTLQPMTPRSLDRVIRQCLVKDPDERWQSTGDLKRELQWVTASVAEPSDAGALSVGRRSSCPCRRARHAPATRPSTGTSECPMTLVKSGPRNRVSRRRILA